MATFGITSELFWDLDRNPELYNKYITPFLKRRGEPAYDVETKESIGLTVLEFSDDTLINELIDLLNHDNPAAAGTYGIYKLGIGGWRRFKQVEQMGSSHININAPNINVSGVTGTVNAAGHDLAINSITPVVYLQALQQAIENTDIPIEEKTNLQERISGIVNNPYVSGIGATVIYEAAKKILGLG
ncbi:MAG: hypothetical protein NTU95_12285 [Methanothrix sp.]|nr:hypothetical protein [Methanothrix sp.]